MRVTVSVLLLASMASQGFAQSKDVAITGAKIVVGDGKVIAAGTLLIHAGKIAALGDNITVPPDAQVIDAKGKVVYPGFIDAYTTRGLKLPDAPSSGTPPDSRTTAPASMWHGNRRGIRADIVASKCLDIKDQLNANYAQGITTAMLTPGTGTIRGMATIVNYTDTGDVLVPVSAGEIAVRGGGFGGGGGGANNNGDTGYPGSLLGIIALERQTLIDAQQYADASPDKKDDALENLRPLVTKQVPILLSADTEREIVRCGHIADEFGYKALYGGAHDAYKVIGMLKASNAAVLAAVDPGAEPPLNGSPSTPDEVLAERHATWVDRSLNIKKLIDAGVPVAFSTFSGNLGDYLKNVRWVISTGVQPDVALKCMTSGAAAILGVSDRIGTLEVGKLADITVMTGDFSDSKSAVDSVYVEGKKMDIKKGAQ